MSHSEAVKASIQEALAKLRAQRDILTDRILELALRLADEGKREGKR